MSRPLQVQYADETDRYFYGDRVLRRVIRFLRTGSPSHLSGVRRVVKNFLTGLDRLGVAYRYNSSSLFRDQGQPVISFGLAELGLKGVSEQTPLIAAIGFPYPTDLPDLCEQYDVRYVLQHSQWVCDLVRSANVYEPSLFNLWPAGVDTETWRPTGQVPTTDVLVYIKIHWDREIWFATLVQPILDQLRSRGLTVTQVIYGSYTPSEYQAKLASTRAFVFLSPHETQGFACLESLASGVPVYAWDPGFWLDPDRFRYGLDRVKATSVPFFDERCGDTFLDSEAFSRGFGEFWQSVVSDSFSPREYVLENVTIEKSTKLMLSYYENL